MMLRAQNWIPTTPPPPRRLFVSTASRKKMHAIFSAIRQLKTMNDERKINLKIL